MSYQPNLPAGSAVSSASAPVVLATDEIVPISATALPLPSGAATSANQATEITSLTTIATNTPAKGSATSANSSPVVIASDQTVPVVLPNRVIVGIAASVAAINTDLLTGTVSGWYDASGFNSISLQIIGGSGVSAGVVSFEQTNDITNAPAGGVAFVTDSASTNTNGVNTYTVAASAVKMYQAPIIARYFRVRVSTAMVGGTVQAVAAFSTIPYSMFQTSASQGASSASAWLANPLNPLVSTIADTGAKTTTFNGTSATNGNGKGALVVLNITAASGTSPTLVAKLQMSADAGTTWVDIPGATTGTITTTGAYGIEVYPGATPVAGVATAGTCAVCSAALARNFRIVYTIGGTTPSFTFAAAQVSFIV